MNDKWHVQHINDRSNYGLEAVQALCQHEQYDTAKPSIKISSQHTHIST